MSSYYMSKTFWKNRKWEEYLAMPAPLHLLIIARETKTGTHKPIRFLAPFAMSFILDQHNCYMFVKCYFIYHTNMYFLFLLFLWWENCKRLVNDRLSNWLPLSQPFVLPRAVHTLRWRHNDRDGVSNHQPYDCVLNRLFRHRWKKTSKLPVTGPCAGNSPVTGEFPAQRASNAENASIWWRHHACVIERTQCHTNMYMQVTT